MRRKKKTTIVTFESRDHVTIRRATQQTTAWCDRCGANVVMFSLNEAAARLDTDMQTIFRCVESGDFHFIEESPGRLLVCSASVAMFGR